AVASTPIHQRGGVIDKFMGTEIMALFNTQLNPHEDHAWAAVQAAIEMVTAFRQLYASQGEPPGSAYYRIGIHSGIATMGNVGSLSRREFTAIGDTVNLSHRLVDMAGAGEILVSQDIFQPCSEHLKRLAERVQVLDRGEITIRGRRQAVRIYQLQARN
ncbi:MAG: adenylate/guanylate cyclase domain-containing protein, partial [Anaerolineae bacterium]|nr:adenylate/guanylate cyclase domain-containing protein [Anaerolineae bacterium]